MSFRLVPKSATVNTNPNLYLLATLNDLERRNGRYFALFHRTRVRRRRKTIISVSKSNFNSL